RGEEPQHASFTLREASSRYSMQLVFISREDYKKKQIPSSLLSTINIDETMIVPEGGHGPEGVKGAKEILQQIDSSQYTHILCAVGTGTTLAGLIESSSDVQQVIGISVFKNNFSLENEIEALLTSKRKNFQLIHDYHFGGYAKYNEELLQFMNDFYRATGIPSDFVYTGKLFFAVKDLIENKYFPTGVKILVIHTGGLQGNSSLPKQTLIF
ncbi:MAG: 1-aminocyclopropane-1-carboxylate deaminase/D-cysteine desulfhydrase, partial [Flavisolibacter sp.]